MCELDCKESLVPKNGCFWTVVLEKTLESPLYCKEIQPVNPKGNQSWIFIGRTDAEAEAPILWPPDVKNWFIWKDPDAGKDCRQEEKGTTEDEMVGWHHRLRWTWVWGSSGSWWWTRKPGVLQSMGSQSRTWLSDGTDWYLCPIHPKVTPNESHPCNNWPPTPPPATECEWELSLASNQLNMTTVLGYHSHDYFMLHKILSQKTGDRDSPAGPEEAVVNCLWRGPQGRELWLASRSWRVSRQQPTGSWRLQPYNHKTRILPTTCELGRGLQTPDETAVPADALITVLWDS